MMLSDEAAANAAMGAGDRHRLARPSAPLYAMEPARFQDLGDGRRRGRFCAPPPILFSSEAPTCTACGERVSWAGRGKRTKGGYVYRIRCSCGPDVLAVPIRLCMGGTVEWWQSQGWRLNI